MSPVPKEPGVNMMPVIVLGVLLLVGLFAAAQVTWIGQLMRQGPRQEDPMEKITQQDARNIIETKITEGLTAVGAKGKFEWKKGEEPADKNSPDPVNLNIDTSLQDPNMHKSIIDPIKDYMDKAKVPTLTMTDEKSHATWTYTVTPPAPAQSPDGADGSQPAQ